MKLKIKYTISISILVYAAYALQKTLLTADHFVKLCLYVLAAICGGFTAKTIGNAILGKKEEEEDKSE